MAYNDRTKILHNIERLRGGRRLIALFNFDRVTVPLDLSGMKTQFHSDVKEALFRVLKETNIDKGLDLCLYTRGGDTNSVWPVVSIIREFDPSFEVLVPYRCHSAGTLVALAARHIHMSALSELSPIDPSAGNQFNPIDPLNAQSRLGIAVEDLQQYRNLVMDQLHLTDDNIDAGERRNYFQPFLAQLTQLVHPLALGNVHRAYMQIQQLAEKLLRLQNDSSVDVERAIRAFTQDFYSHMHMINRDEALEFLGERIVAMPDNLAVEMDSLLRQYQESFKFPEPFFLAAHMGDDALKEVRFVGGVVESSKRSYLFVTEAAIRQYCDPPSNVNVQLAQNQQLPLIPGLPRRFDVQIKRQSWVHNERPKGVTI